MQLIGAGSVATFAGGPRGNGCTWHGMRWHSEHGMGHLRAPQDSPAAGARRYGHGLTKSRTREKMGRRMRLWRYISGKIVEPRSQKFQESSSSRDGDMRLGWLAPPALRLALSYICMRSHPLSRALAAHVTAPLSTGRVAWSRHKSQLGYFRFGCVLTSFGRVGTVGMERGYSWSFVPFQPVFRCVHSNYKKKKLE